MKKLYALAAVAVMTLVGACQLLPSLSDPTTAFTGVEATYVGALAAENVYLSSSKADPAIAAQIETYRVQAHAVIAPVAAQIAAGNPPTSDQLLAAQTAVSALTVYMTANGINTGS